MELPSHLFDNHLNKCRCCLNPFTSDCQKIEITKEFEIFFYEVTSLRLRLSSLFSSHLCPPCIENLENFTKFKAEIYRKQKRLYEIVDGCKRNERRRNLEDPEVKFEPTFIKIEPKDEIEVKEEFLEINCEREEFYEENMIIEPPEHFYEEDQGESDEDLIEKTFKTLPTPRKKSKNQKPMKKIVKIFCSQCPRYFHSQQNLDQHINRDHLNLRSYECKQCDYKTSQLSSLQGHVNRLHGAEADKKEQCQKCGLFVKDLKNHEMGVHIRPRNVICDICGYGIHSLNRLRRHMLRHMSKEYRFQSYGIQCNICGAKLIGGEKGLALHHKNMHSETSERYTCDCGKTYTLLSSLKAHQKFAHQPKDSRAKFECRICHKLFIHKQSLTDHYEIHQRKESDRYACQICGKVYKAISLLNNHMIFHTEASFQCKLCDKKFVRNCFLTKHIKRQHEVEFTQCSYCGKEMKILQLTRHVREFHSGLEKQNCPVEGCNSNFLRKWHMKDHMDRCHKNYENSLSPEEKIAFEEEIKRIHKFML